VIKNKVKPRTSKATQGTAKAAKAASRRGLPLAHPTGCHGFCGAIWLASEAVFEIWGVHWRPLASLVIACWWSKSSVVGQPISSTWAADFFWETVRILGDAIPYVTR
jgi:hypothetical protein